MESGKREAGAAALNDSLPHPGLGTTRRQGSPYCLPRGDGVTVCDTDSEAPGRHPSQAPLRSARRTRAGGSERALGPPAGRRRLVLAPAGPRDSGPEGGER